MEKWFIRSLSNDGSVRGPVNLQKKLVENRRPKAENVPDLTDFMNDMFFGAANRDMKTYNLTGNRDGFAIAGDDFLEPGRRSVSSRSTQEWLDEAKRMVAKSPARDEPPSRAAGSPRFSNSQPNGQASLDRRDPISRSARRYRSPQGFSGEILSKTGNKHTRNNSQVSLDSVPDDTRQPASAVQNWLSNILKPQNGASPNNIPNHPIIPSDPISPKSLDNPAVPPLPPQQSASRKSRFQSNTNAPRPALIPPLPNPFPSKRTFKNPAPLKVTATNTLASLDTQLLSPPKHLVESAHRRSISSSTCSVPDTPSIKPLRNIADTGHQRSASDSAEKILQKKNENEQVPQKHSRNHDLNRYLKEQKVEVQKIQSGESNRKAKIVLSGHNNSTSSMVAAICYAWWLENKARGDKKGEETNMEVMVPVMNMRRGQMWKLKQAAWLYHHVGLDASSLLFYDEVDLEMLVMEKKLSILIVGQHILRTNAEVGSACTIMTDNYCEDAYDLLQTPMLKKLLLAGILIDTQNLNASTKLSITRDSVAIQLLSVGSVPNYRNTLFDELIQDQRDDTFREVLEKNYGVCTSESNQNKGSPNDGKNGRSNKIAPSLVKTKASTGGAKAGDPQKGQNVFFLTKWFGLGPK